MTAPDPTQAIRARLKAATTAVSLDVWPTRLRETPDGDHDIEQVHANGDVTQMATVWGSEPFASLLAHAPSDIAALLALVDAAREETRLAEAKWKACCDHRSELFQQRIDAIALLSERDVVHVEAQAIANLAHLAWLDPQNAQTLFGMTEARARALLGGETSHE